jgi:hypothetical protein
MAKRGPKNPMTPEHKAALALGRVEGRVVREYLEALRANKPTPGRKRTPESVKKRLSVIDTELASADPVKELRLIQERLDLQNELDGFEHAIDIGSRESEFVKIAKSYSHRNGVSYAAWRTVGVSAAVLKSAGITRAT